MDVRPGIVIRPDRPDDFPAITRVNDAAFGRDVEGKLVAGLRERGGLIASLVAVTGDRVVGHIAFSLVTTAPPVADVRLACLAPVAVLPDFQDRGIGGSLVRQGLAVCWGLGIEGVFLVGHADYYPRFGFVKAADYGIACEFEAPSEAWMVMALKTGTLEKLRGVTAVFHPIFRKFV